MQHHALLDLLNEKLASVATDIQAIEELINSEPQTTDQILALRTIQELYRRLADDLRIALPLRVAHAGAKAQPKRPASTERTDSGPTGVERTGVDLSTEMAVISKGESKLQDKFSLA
jgi:hypothetical protein